MLVCNLKPEDQNICMDCVDTQIRADECINCVQCPYKEVREDHILVSVGTTIFGRDYAVVTYGENRRLKKVPLHRVMCVREE